MIASLQIPLNLLFTTCKLRIMGWNNTDASGMLLMFWRNLLPPSPGLCSGTRYHSCHHILQDGNMNDSLNHPMNQWHTLWIPDRVIKYTIHKNISKIS